MEKNLLSGKNRKSKQMLFKKRRNRKQQNVKNVNPKKKMSKLVRKSLW